MADNKSVNFLRPRMMVPDGRAIFIQDQVLNPTLIAADTFSWRIPKGMEVVGVRLFANDIESGGPASLFRLGYLKLNAADTLTAVDNYFAAAGQTLLQAGGTLVCGFAPIKFEVDAILQLLLNTGGTAQAGSVWAIIEGNMRGVEGSSTTGLGVVN